MSGFAAGEALRGAGVAALFLLVFAAAELWKRYGSPEPEWTRKLVHFGGGVVALALPWVVRSHWTVLGLALAFAAIIIGTRRLGVMGSVHGVARKSQGGLYFPIAVYGMFLLAAGRPVLYLISLSTLVVCDALAALVGSAYGTLHYAAEGDRRSVEGSAIFFLATFLTVHLPLLLLTPVDRRLAVLAAVQIALLVTLLEAISLEGSDNLVVPFGTFLLLLKLTPQAPETILWQLLAQLAILAVLFLAVWRARLLTSAGTLAASLVLYGAWSLGGPAWGVAPVAGLVGLIAIQRRAAGVGGSAGGRYQVLAVFYTSIVPVALVIANNVLKTVVRDPVLGVGDPLYPLFLGALAANLAVLALVFWRGTPWPASATLLQGLGSYLVGTLAIVPVGWLAHPGTGWRGSWIAAAVAALSLLAYLAMNRYGRHPRERPWDGRLRAAAAALGVALLLPAVVHAW